MEREKWNKERPRKGEWEDGNSRWNKGIGALAGTNNIRAVFSHSPSVLWMFMLQPTSMLHVP